MIVMIHVRRTIRVSSCEHHFSNAHLMLKTNLFVYLLIRMHNLHGDILYTCTVVAVTNVCHFPAYLRRTAMTTTTSATGDESSTAADSQWVTELRYSALTEHIQSRLDIVVFDTELIAKVSFAVECRPGSSGATDQPCYQTELVYRRSCVDRVSGDKFKVLHNEGL